MRTIVVIENERMVYLDIKITFARYGYDVVHVNELNVKQVLASGMVPDMIIMDVLSARQINGSLKFPFGNDPVFKDVPIILTNTGFSSFRFCMRYALNIIGEFDKPYDASDLVKHYSDFLLTEEVPMICEYSEEPAYA